MRQGFSKKFKKVVGTLSVLILPLSTGLTVAANISPTHTSQTVSGPAQQAPTKKLKSYNDYIKRAGKEDLSFDSSNKVTEMKSRRFKGGFAFETQDGAVYVSDSNYLYKKNEGGTFKRVDTQGLGILKNGFMFQAKDGTLYLLNRPPYGGSKLFKKTSKGFKQINGVKPQYMFETKDGNIFLGGEINGKVSIFKLNKKTNTFDDVNKSHMHFPFLTNSMFQDKDGNIFIGGTEGVALFDEKTTNISPVFGAGDSDASLFQTEDGTIYYFTKTKKKLRKYDKKSNTFREVQGSPLVTNASMLQTHYGTLYLNSDENFYRIENGKFIVENLHIPANFSRNSPNPNIKYMFQTKKGDVYLAFYSLGLFKIKPNNSSFTPMNKDADVLFSFMLETTTNKVYIGMNGRLHELNKTINKFEKTVVPFDIEDGFMFQDDQGKIYLGTKNNQLHEFFERTNTTSLLRSDIKTRGGSMYQTQDKTLYLLGADFLYKRNTTTGKFEKVGSIRLQKGAMMFQAKDKTIYLGTASGLVILDKNGGTQKVNDVPRKINGWIMAQESNGDLLLGSDRSIYRKTSGGQKFIKINGSPDPTDGFLYKTKNGRVYLGTGVVGYGKGGGLFEVVGNSFEKVGNMKEFKHGFMYQTDDGTVYLAGASKTLYSDSFKAKEVFDNKTFLKDLLAEDVNLSILQSKGLKLMYKEVGASSGAKQLNSITDLENISLEKTVIWVERDTNNNQAPALKKDGYSVILEKKGLEVKIIKTKETKPSYNGAGDGKMEVEIEGFNPSTMTTEYDANHTYKVKRNTNTLSFTELTSGQKVKMKIHLKDKLHTFWKGTKTTNEKDLTAPTNPNAPIKVPSQTSLRTNLFTNPHFKTETVTLTLPNVDQNLESHYSLDGGKNWTKKTTKTITGVLQDTHVLLKLTPKSGFVWDEQNHANTPKEFSLGRAPASKITAVTKPTLGTQTPTSTKTKTTKDGSISFVLTGFDQTTMNIATDKGNIEHDANGTPRKVVGLADGEGATLTVSLKKPTNHQWNSTKTNTSLTFALNPITASPNQGLTKPKTIGAPTFSPPTFKTDKVNITSWNLNLGSIAGSVDVFYKVDKGTFTKLDPNNLPTGLNQNSTVEVQLRPKANFVWDDDFSTTPYTSGTNYHWSVPSTNVEEVKKPSVTFTHKSDAHTTTSKDGELEFTLSNFDSSTTTVKFEVKGTTTTRVLTAKFNSKTKGKITGIGSGEVVTATFELKDKKGHKWTDNTDADVTLTVKFKTQNNQGVSKPTTSFAATFNPTSAQNSSTVIGAVMPTIPNNLMGEYQLDNGAWTQFTSGQRIPNIPQGKTINIRFKPKTGFVWDDSSYGSNWIDVGQSIAPVDKTIALAKPSVSSTTPTSSNTTTSNDGSIEFVLNGFDPKTMKLSTNNGTLKSGQTGNYSVVGLANGQGAILTISLVDKATHEWDTNDNKDLTFKLGTTTATKTIGLKKPTKLGNPVFSTPKSKSEKVNMTTAPVVNLSGKVTREYRVDGKGAWSTSKPNGLGQGKVVEVRLTPIQGYVWEDDFKRTAYANTGQGYSWKTPTSNVEEVSPPEVKFGKEKPASSNTSSNGELEFNISNYDPSTVDIEVVGYDSSGNAVDLSKHKTFVSGKAKVVGISSGMKIEIKFSLKNPNKNIWSDSKDASVKSKDYKFSETKEAEVPKPTPASVSASFNTVSLSTDKVEITMPNFNRNLQATYSTNHGKTWVPFTPNQKIDNFGQNVDVSFRFKPKSGFVWADASGNGWYTEGSAESPQSTATGLKKPSLKSSKGTASNTKTSADGSISFILDDFDPSAVTLTTDKGRLDDPSHPKKILGLKDGESATLTFKINDKNRYKWYDRSQSDITISLGSISRSTKTGVKLPKNDSDFLPTHGNSRGINDVIVTMPNIPRHLIGTYELDGSGKRIPFTSGQKITLKQGTKIVTYFELKDGYVWEHDFTTKPVTKELVLPKTNRFIAYSLSQNDDSFEESIFSDKNNKVLFSHPILIVVIISISILGIVTSIVMTYFRREKGLKRGK